MLVLVLVLLVLVLVLLMTMTMVVVVTMMPVVFVHFRESEQKSIQGDTQLLCRARDTFQVYRGKQSHFHWWCVSFTDRGIT